MGEQRDAYLQKLKAKIDAWNNDIDKLQANAGRAGASARVELQKHIEDLKTMRKDFQDKIGRLQRAGEEAWEGLRTGVDAAWKALDDAIQAAKSKLK